MAMNSVVIRLPDGRVIGEVRDGVFCKRVRGSVHFLRRPPAIAYDDLVLRDAQRAGATMVEVTDTETGTVYRAPLQRVWEKGFRVDYGHGRQIALRLEDWDAQEGPRQLRLFG